MKCYDVPQGGPDWHELRRGVPTASSFDKIITPKTMKPSAQADDYIDQLIADTINLSPTWFSERGGKPPNRAMQNGTDTEPEARRWYSLDHPAVVQVGFCMDDEGRFGCSPDGLVGEDGLLELKCPMLQTQAKYIREGGILPFDYRPQVHGQLLVTGRKWVDFMSYSPPLPIILIRVVPDEFTEALREALEKFWVRYQAARAACGLPLYGELANEVPAQNHF